MTGTTASELDASSCDALRARLKSIEGQARGIERMIEEGRDCHEILEQLAALRAATQAASMRALEAFALHCLRESPGAAEEVVSEILGTVSRLAR